MLEKWTLKHKLKKYSKLAWFICIIAALFYCYEYVLRIVPSVMSLELRQNFNNLTASGLGMLTSIYYWSYTSMQAVVGVTTDRYGPRNTLLFSVLLCAIGNYLFGATTNLYIAGFGRFITGMGSAFAFVGALKLAAIWLPKKYFPFFTGIVIALGMLSAIIGDFCMTWLVVHTDWRHVFIICTIAGAILFGVFFVTIYDRYKKADKRLKRNSLRFMFKLFGSMMLKKEYILTGIVGCLLCLSLAGFADMWGIPFLKTVYPDKALQASGLNSAVYWGWFIGSPLIAFYASKINARRSIIFTGAILSAISFSIILIWPHMPITCMVILLFLFGFFCSTETLCIAIARDYASLKVAGTAIGVVNLYIMLSGLILQPLMGHLLDWTWTGSGSDKLRIYTLSNYRIALISLPVAVIIAAILTIWIKDKTHASQKI